MAFGGIQLANDEAKSLAIEIDEADLRWSERGAPFCAVCFRASLFSRKIILMIVCVCAPFPLVRAASIAFAISIIPSLSESVTAAAQPPAAS